MLLSYTRCPSTVQCFYWNIHNWKKYNLINKQQNHIFLINLLTIFEYCNIPASLRGWMGRPVYISQATNCLMYRSCDMSALWWRTRARCQQNNDGGKFNTQLPWLHLEGNTNKHYSSPERTNTMNMDNRRDDICQISYHNCTQYIITIN